MVEVYFYSQQHNINNKINKCILKEYQDYSWNIISKRQELSGIFLNYQDFSWNARKCQELSCLPTIIFFFKINAKIKDFSKEYM